MTIKTILFILLFLVSFQNFAQGDGPRTFKLIPKDMNIVSVFGLFINSNQAFNSELTAPGSDVSSNIGVLTYVRVFDLNGQLSSLSVLLPFGKIDGELFPSLPNPVEIGSSGFGDAFINFTYGITGLPAQTLEEYLEGNNVGFGLGAIVGLYFPTGIYDKNELVNMSTNRFALRIGALLSYSLGSRIPGKLTSFELTPSLFFYTKNKDIENGNSLKQDMMFKLESHITRDLSKMFWLSLDSFYFAGGETAIDDIKKNNNQSSFSLGGTLGINLPKSFSGTLSYGGTVAHNEWGMDGTLFRFTLGKAF